MDNETFEKTHKLPSKTAYDFLLERNANHMHNNAISFENKIITYEELHTRIDEYARALYHNGVEAGVRVAVCLLNTPESIYILYALNKLGATVVGLSPLNNEYKMKRDIEMTNPSILICVDALYPTLKKVCQSMEIETFLYSAVESVNNIFIKISYNVKQFFSHNAINPDNYLIKIVNKKNGSDYKSGLFDNDAVTDIMFTGGSTGTHKSVLLNDNGLNSVVFALDNVFGLEPGMKHLGNIPFGHMAFGRLVLHYAMCNSLEFALTLNMLPNKFLDELIRTQADGAMGGPVHWNTLINNPKIKKGALSNLKQAISGGEMYVPDQRVAAEKELKKAGCKVGIGDGLGLTETWAPINICVSGKATSGTVGKPIPFVKEKVVDPETFAEVPNNEPGLLLVNSPGLMLRYSDEAETNKVISYDKYGRKWYNTGDLVIKLDSGEIKFAGRKKRNFVSGVDNIYPEQIETLVSKLPEIRQIVVTKVPDSQKQNLPKYHIVLFDTNVDKEIVEEKIKTLIKNTLGASALPGYIEYHENELPRTDNGKLNATLLGEEDMKKHKRG